jgi:hypothetical protein
MLRSCLAGVAEGPGSDGGGGGGGIGHVGAHIHRVLPSKLERHARRPTMREGLIHCATQGTPKSNQATDNQYGRLANQAAINTIN